MRIMLLIGFVGFAVACDSARSSPPPAQPSSLETPSVLSRVARGQAFSPPCIIVEKGATVEWRNLSPSSGVILVSVAAPYELSSPSLRAPYNFVPPEQSDECTTRTNGACTEPLPFSFWRHTFQNSGIFDYQDQSGSAAASVVGEGDEYGLPAGPVNSGTGGTGTVCVSGPGTSCVQVCCTSNVVNQCPLGVSCIGGRCGGVQP